MWDDKFVGRVKEKGMTETWKCLLINHRHNPVTVTEQDGTPIVTLRPKRKVVDPQDGTKREFPGDEFTLEATDPTSTFARFSSVVFLHEAPWAQCTVREGWVEPRRKHPCEVILLQGAEDPEWRTFGEQSVCLMHGVPIVIDVDALDEMARFDRVTCGVVKQDRRLSERHDGYVIPVQVREDVKHLRSPEALEALKQEMEKQNV